MPIKDVLHSESLFLVTSRYKDVLTSSGIADSSIYKLIGLNKQHSRQLFCSHAFLQPFPLPGFEYLVGEFCKACDGLPLSLRVFGALLCGKNEKPYWEGQLIKLRQIKLPNEIKERLKISYDALEEDEKQIFLDIACYFINKERDTAIKVWDGSGWNGLVGFRNLQDKCLVDVHVANVNDYDDFGVFNVIKMHDHLRDVGREIADLEMSSGVTPHRLWRVIEDIDDLSKQSSVITEVRGIRTAASEFIDFNEISESEELFDQVLGKRKLTDRIPYCFTKLQLVETQGRALKTILRMVESPNLKWLSWTNCPYTSLPKWIPMKNLRVLDVQGEFLETLWKEESQVPLELRELYIRTYSWFQFPEYSWFQFPKSIERLKHIEKIVFKYNLQGLPDSFGCLTNLQHLDLSQCESLQGLPDSFGCLTNLQHLDLLYCRSLQGLPDSFGCLTNLQHLDLYLCESLQGLPDSFGCLTNLQHLYLSQCNNLQRLPDSFGCLTNLQHLDLSHCESLQGLPDSFGCLTNLQHLDLSYCMSLQGLPDSFGWLSANLQYLGLIGVSTKSYLGLIGVPKSTSAIRFQHLCNSCGRRRKNDWLCDIADLEEPNLCICIGVEELPRLESFEDHCSSCGRLRKIDWLCDLTDLKEPNICMCLGVEELERLKSLKKSAGRY